MTLTIVAVIFGVFATGLIALLIYKSTLTMHRDDQLFLDDASSHMHEEQTELLAKVNRLTIPMRVFSIGSGVFLIALPEAERRTVASKAGDLRPLRTSLQLSVRSLPLSISPGSRERSSATRPD
jgi:hypothetical protein